MQTKEGNLRSRGDTDDRLCGGPGECGVVNEWMDIDAFHLGKSTVGGLTLFMFFAGNVFLFGGIFLYLSCHFSLSSGKMTA
jgi:hypothetical protein